MMADVPGSRESSLAKEIYDTVYRNVMKEVQESLSQMKPQLVREVADEAAQQVIGRYEQRIQRLEQRVQQLEQEKNSGAPKDRNASAGNAPKKTVRVDVSRIWDGFRFGGWIYYPNKNMGDFLYKVREDGSENTQLTDYSVVSNFSISDGYLCFWDTDLRDRKIKIG